MMKSLTCLFAVAGLAFAGHAAATDYSFTESYDEGATFSGTFSGIDLNGDGELSSFDGELTAFSGTFSGNSFVSSFSIGLEGVYGLVYDLDGYLGDGTSGEVEGFEGYDDSFTYLIEVGTGPFATCDGVEDCGLVTTYGETDGHMLKTSFVPLEGGPGYDLTTQGLVIAEVTPGGVPEPASWAMFIGGFGLIGAGLRTRRTALAC